ncbi:MAG: GNAT family N-acetyltransferase [Candidatus Hydrogenedentes bacterium]|nr:GNAT family N-acetyltransferase [Candidatus Hydrogenedentota bacterium]
MPFSTTTFIRRAERDDLDTVVAWMENEDFQRFLYGDPARSPKQVREKIVAMLGRAVGHTMPGGIYLLIDSPEQGPVGLLSLQNISWRNRSCSVDLYIGKEKHRNGMVAAGAVYQTLEYCFHELNLHRISAYIYSFNSASWRIFEMTGAVRELTLRDHVARDGVLHDLYGYGLLRSEFDAFRVRYHRATEGLSLKAMIEALGASGTEPEV